MPCANHMEAPRATIRSFIQITAAELFFHLTGYRSTTVRLAAVVPASMSLLSTHSPRWSNTAAARASVAGGLLRLIQAALVPESRIRHPELLEAIIAPMATPTGISTLLSSLEHGATFLTAKSAACLYWVVTHRGGKLDCLDIAVAQVQLPSATTSRSHCCLPCSHQTPRPYACHHHDNSAGNPDPSRGSRVPCLGS